MGQEQRYECGWQRQRFGERGIGLNREILAEGVNLVLGRLLVSTRRNVGQEETYSQLRELSLLMAQQGFELQLAGRREVHDSRN
jgi:hypothetical protein